ncbi:hypothetical protein MKX03_021051 [Papaver bracteatum]|nr:hypothetical protein MKX03_021051 [Papaver bracteatum]
MASIRDKLKMSFEEEEEERKSNAILRDELIARTVKQRESTNEYLKVLGEEPISYDSEITEHDWLLKPPIFLKRITTDIPNDDDSQGKLFIKRRRYPAKAFAGSKVATVVDIYK